MIGILVVFRLNFNAIGIINSSVEEFSFRPRAIVGFSNCLVKDLQDSAMYNKFK